MMTDTKTESAKYGYCITTTPGLIEDGSFALSADAVRRGEIERADNNPAVWETRQQAEAAMMRLVPDGSNPAVYAGLAVAAAYDVCLTQIAYGLAEGMDGFVVPVFRD